jgi:broad specificity phosphatase PhoE
MTGTDGGRVVYLVRHARSDERSRELVPTPRGPQWDPPLGDVGRSQARRLAARLLLLEPPPPVVYCSTLRRARETIEPYREAAGADVRLDPDLMEGNAGAWEGKSFEELIAADASLLARFREGIESFWRESTNAEPLSSIRRRAGAAIQRILDRHPDGDVFVVTHGGVINAVVGDVLGLEHGMLFLPENTSLSSIVVEGSRRSVRFLNDDRHLTQPHLFAPAEDAPLGGPSNRLASEGHNEQQP